MAVVVVDGGLKEAGVDGELESLEIEVNWDGSDVDVDKVHIFLFIYALMGANYTSYLFITIPIPTNPIYLAPFADVTNSAGNSSNLCPAPSHSHLAASQASVTNGTMSSPHRTPASKIKSPRLHKTSTKSKTSSCLWPH